MVRWVLGGWPAVEAAGRMFNTVAVRDTYGRPVLLFKNEFSLQQVRTDWAFGRKAERINPCAYQR